MRNFPVKIEGTYKGHLMVSRLNNTTLHRPDDAKVGEIVRMVGGVTGEPERLFRVKDNRDGLDVSRELGKFYLGGPMRGLPLRNFPAFLTAAPYLRTLGFEIICPAAHDLKRGVDMKNTKPDPALDESGLAWDFTQIVQADGIILLDGWENSVGAKAERLVAEMTGKVVLRLSAALDLFSEDGWRSSLDWSNVNKPKAVALPAPGC